MLTSDGALPQSQSSRPPDNMLGGQRRRDPRQPSAPAISAQHRAIVAKTSRTGKPAAAGAVRVAVGNAAKPLPSQSAGFGRQPSAFPLPKTSSSRRSHKCATMGLETLNVRYYIRIENEFQLRRLDERPPENIYEHFTKAGMRKETVEHFLDSVVARYNRARIFPSPSMSVEKMKREWWPSDWTIVEEYAVMRNIRIWEPNKFWGVEMRSPKFWASPDSNWINQVQQTWSWLENNYEISKSVLCSTRIHISTETGFVLRRTSLRHLKNIAQCIIHFETAVEACAPLERQSNLSAKSNWIDNLNFADESITRRRAIDMIELCATENDLIELMSPGSEYFAWNFRALKKQGSVEFRKGGASLRGNEAIAWAQLVLQFVESAITLQRSSWETIPANVGGLKSFLGNDSYGYLHPILKGIEDTESAQPGIMSQFQNQAEHQALQRKLDADQIEQLKLSREERA